MHGVTIAEIRRLGVEDATAGEDIESIAEGIREHYGITFGNAYLTAARKVNQ